MHELEALSAQLKDRERQLVVLEDLLQDRHLSKQGRPSGRPIVEGWLSSHFGRRTDPFTGRPALHAGVDFAGKAGSDIVSVAAGVVTWSAQRNGYGNLVEINHGNGYVTRYAHNQRNLVAAGTAEFRQRLHDGATLDELLPEAFAVVREAGKRVLGMRHFDVQLIGGMVLHEGRSPRCAPARARPWWRPWPSISMRCPARACMWSR
jgi:hypothetical protein